MRIMPFLTAADDCVTYEVPELRYGMTRRLPDEPASDWDYSVPLQVSGAARVDASAFLRSTGLDSLDQAVFVLTVDCPSTGYREVAGAPLQDVDGAITVGLEIPEHRVAVRLEVTCAVLLGVDRVPTVRGEAAHRKGSRLHRSNRTYAFPLEGTGSGFPTEAFNFSKVDGFPDEAPWVLEFSADDLHAPFLGVTRLFINEGHPVGPVLLTGGNTTLMSVLRYDVVLQMLNSIADQVDQVVGDEFPQGSVGEIVGELADLHLGMSLVEVGAALRNDRSRVQRRLRAAMELLNGGA